MCPTFRSLHTAGGVEFFDIGCWQITASHCYCQARQIGHGAPVPPGHAAAGPTV
ncbi:unnamed protein product [Staurois parvus]|uniref:Uncharacterized protein n=1 Tax=Staurois parvus TaxID=386267 RepID=A0ABN9AYC5_9NEOB|nr:unnamed protein product [Staurois parvus]